MRKVAIPVSKGHLSEYFGQCNHWQIFEIDGKQIKSLDLEVPPFRDIDKMTHWAASLGITDVITHQLEQQAIPLFSSNKINLFIGISIDVPETLIDRYLEGTLVSDAAILKSLTHN